MQIKIRKMWHSTGAGTSTQVSITREAMSRVIAFYGHSKLDFVFQDYFCQCFKRINVKFSGYIVLHIWNINIYGIRKETLL